MVHLGNNCSLPGFYVHGILQARMLEWVAISFSSRSSLSRDQTQVSCITGGFFTLYAIREAHLPPHWPLYPTACSTLCLNKNMHVKSTISKAKLFILYFFSSFAFPISVNNTSSIFSSQITRENDYFSFFHYSSYPSFQKARPFLPLI